MATTTSIPQGLRELRSLWWIFMLFGVLALAAGIILIAWPGISLVTLAVVAGIFLLVDGVFAVVGSILAGKGAEGRGLLAIIGVLSVIAGIVMVKHPFNTLVILVIILGLWLVLSGIVRFVAAVAEQENRPTNIAVGIFDLVAGIVILVWPGIGLSTLAILAGIIFIARGVVFFAGGLQLRRLPKTAAA
ncbi:unannotated protein [freshwater metagenome]|uniref:Unannotated protein n=1 Tax=freshwater metagenome TaxID=449393 RepID=A0A6J7DH57_9ZZZZ|nr:hypothetical protein [Actinomycetota bacterium]